MVIWIIGLSGSGKTTLGSEIFRQWRRKEPNTVLLDGDELRHVFAHDYGVQPYTLQGRHINAERMVALCELLDKQGTNVVCCLLSLFPEMRAENRKRFSRYFEIFMDAPLDILVERDPKGIYAAAKNGKMNNVVGIDLPFERPTNSDVVIDSIIDNNNIKQLASQLIIQAQKIKTESVTYDYALGDILENKNTYFYSRFLGGDFIKAWYQQRAEALKLDEHGITCVEEKIDVAPVIQVLKLICGHLCQETQLKDVALQHLNKLLQHFEVTKRLYNKYDENWQPLNKKDYRNMECYIYFAETLNLAYMKTEKLQYLNTFLKCLDILTATELCVQLNISQKKRIIHLIGYEHNSVQRLLHRQAKKKHNGKVPYNIDLLCQDFWYGVLKGQLSIQYRLSQHLKAQSENWPKEKIYTQGYYYQGLEELGILGVKPTHFLFSQYQVDDIIRQAEVLDIGSNCGFLASYCAKLAKSVTAIELNPFLNFIARDIAFYLKLRNVHFLEEDFTTTTIHKKFDVVFSFSNHHTIDGNLYIGFEAYIQKIVHYLKQNGYLLFESHNVFGPGQGGIGDDGDMENKIAIMNKYFTIERYRMVQCHLKGIDIDKLFIVAKKCDSPIPVQFNLLEAREKYQW